MEKVEKYYNENGDVGVLISPGWGSGWSIGNEKEIAVDKRVIEKFLEKPTEDEMRDYLVSLGYYKPLIGGYESLELQFAPKGSIFKVNSYDGNESLEIVDLDGNYFIAE